MKIESVKAYPLTQKLHKAQVTSQAAYAQVSICLVRIETDEGIEGVGECLARFAPAAYAHLIDTLLSPVLVGSDPLCIAELWRAMRTRLSGRSGGILFEAIAGVDIALWDILGKAHNAPVWRLFGEMNRTRVPAYASSIMVDEEVVDTANQVMDMGFRIIKLKIGGVVCTELRRAEKLRETVGDDVELVVDANYIYDEGEALYLSEGLADLGVRWLEEPIDPENRDGYLRLSRRSRVPLAAGESEYTAHDFADLISEGAIRYAQPDVTRAGGISETRRIAALADAFHVRYAPHVGFSGIVCIFASLHLAAAAPNTYAYECMITPSAFREQLAANPVGLYTQVEDGEVSVPGGPGLGIEMEWKEVERFVER